MMITKDILDKKEQLLQTTVHEGIKYALLENEQVALNEEWVDAVTHDGMHIYVLHTFDDMQNHLNEHRAMLENDSVDIDDIKPINDQYRGFAVYIDALDECITILMHPDWSSDKTTIITGNVFIFGDGSVETEDNDDADRNQIASIISALFNDAAYHASIKNRLFELAEQSRKYEEKELFKKANETGIININIRGNHASVTLSGGLTLLVEKTELQDAIHQKVRPTDNQ